MVNSHLVCDPTIRQPGFNLPQQQWSLLNRFRTERGHCGACRRKWRLTDIDLCPCGETQTMFHIVESCPLTKLNGFLSRLHSADEDAVSWLRKLWLMTCIREDEEVCRFLPNVFVLLLSLRSHLHSSLTYSKSFKLMRIVLKCIDFGSFFIFIVDYSNISKFLNRILGVEVELQNKLFRYFTDTLTSVILDQKRRGAWDMGILGVWYFASCLVYIFVVTNVFYCQRDTICVIFLRHFYIIMLGWQSSLCFLATFPPLQGHLYIILCLVGGLA